VRLIPLNRDSPVYDEIPASRNSPEILIFDAEVPEHLQTIANELWKMDMLTVSAGCAGFAEALMEVLPLEKNQTPNTDECETNTDVSFRNTLKKLPVLIISGSLHPVSVNQIRAALKKNILRFSMAGEIMASPGWNESAEAETLATSCALALEQQGICVLGTEAALGTKSAYKTNVTPNDNNRKEVAASPIVSATIAEALGETTLRIIQKTGPLHLVIFGGDSLLGIIKSLNCNCIIPLDEILPGIALSHPVGETSGGLLVTKAGAFGDIDVIQTLLEQFSQTL
jgi:uncharacterized protein YgbK (DUF1537 family)